MELKNVKLFCCYTEKYKNIKLKNNIVIDCWDYIKN